MNINTIKNIGRTVTKRGLREWILWSIPTTMTTNMRVDSDQLLIWYVGEGDDMQEVCRSEGGKRTYTPLFFSLAKEVMQHALEETNG